MNETPQRTADDGAIRRLVTELVDEAPPASDWSQIELRVDQPNGTTSITDTHRGRSRPGLMLVAAAATAALVGGAALVATRGSGTDDRLVPTDSDVPTTIAEEVATPTTEAPLFEPVPTTETLPVESTPVTTQEDAVSGVDPDVVDPTFEGDPSGDEPVDDVFLPVDYPEIVLADATSLPDDAWVVAGTLPDGIAARYAIVDVGRRVTYGDADDRSIEVATDFQPIGGAETLDVDGILWSFDSFEDSAAYTREIGLITISVTTVGIDRDAAIAVLRDLRAGGDQLLPVDVIQPVDVVRRDNDLVASDDAAFGGPATFRARGVNGWYCTEINYTTGSGSGCGDGRNGRLATDVFPQSSSIPDQDGSDRVVLSGIVAPEVAEVEVVLADGASERAPAVDLSGTHEDRFWILEIDLSSDDPFVDRFVGIEVRLLAADGSVLGTAPIAA